MPESVYFAAVHIKIDGSLLSDADMVHLHLTEVDNSLHLPAEASLTFYDEKLVFTDNASKFDVGKEVEILFKGTHTGAAMTSVFKGVIAAIEPEFTAGAAYSLFVVRAYDRSFWLHRGNKSATYVQMKDSDIIQKVCREAGLSPAVQDTNVVREHVFRDNISDFDFIKQVAARNGFVTQMDDRTLKAKPLDAMGKPEVQLEYGNEVLEFRPIVSLAAQVNELSARGWDRKTKQLVNGISNASSLESSGIGLGSRGSALAQRASGASKKLSIADTWNTQASADAQAKAAYDTLSAGDITGEGWAIGNPRIQAGGKLKILKLGERFSGTYVVTRVRHTFDQKTAFRTQFWMGGMASGTFASLVQDPAKVPGVRTQIQHGLLTGIVTNLNDPEAQGRVKVKFPALAEEHESFWCPVISVGAGNGRGLMILPDVNDEVMVAFEHGDINRPYILGGLWNGKDAPPESLGANGSNDIKVYKSKAGHILRFTDKSGGEKIELIDKTGKNLFSIDSVSGDVVIKAAGKFTIEAKMDVEIKGMNVKIKGQGTGAFEAQTKMELKGAMVDVVASGMTKISGATVMIN